MNLSQVKFSRHFLKQATLKGFTAEQIASAIQSPYKVTDVSRYPGQKRYCGSGVAVVMDDTHALTIYADGVVTPMRDDQKDDSAAVSSKRLNRS